ncbi:MAG: hypothetical protein KDA44_06040, partial [Planctomycetales bacterium]|nr:hypothetical protein [Planctomycetales bacterium]
MRLADEQDVFKDDSDRLSALRDHLRVHMGAERFDLWLGAPNELTLAPGELHVYCASRAEVLWIRRKMLVELTARCGEFLGAETEIRLHVRQAAAAKTPAPQHAGDEPSGDAAHVQPLLTDEPQRRRA